MANESAFTAENIVSHVLAAAEGYDFDTFVIGFERREEEPPEDAERLRRLKSVVGTDIGRRWPQRRAEFRRPEARIDVHRDLSVEIRTLPLFIAARYRKLLRTAPASRWMCLTCSGEGCEGCDWTGNLCGPSVEETIGRSLLELTRGDATCFHGSGREDTDVRMLGGGRPFVIEVSNPVRRKIDLDAWVREADIDGRNICEVLAPAFVARDAVRLVKESGAAKTYRAWIRFASTPPADTAERIAALEGASIAQLSPTRVMHRRGRDALRPKRILRSQLVGFLAPDRDSAPLGVWELSTESGAYIKEIISGDGGRTRPSVSEALGIECHCESLDVLEIHWRGPWEGRNAYERARAHDGAKSAAQNRVASGDAATPGGARDHA